jgi:hypothetical protein
MGVFDGNGRSYEAEDVTLTSVSGSYIGYTLPTAAVTSTAESGGTLTVTTTAPHPFKTGDEVTLSGATGNNAAQYNKNHTITRTSNNTFTATITTGDQVGISDTILVSRSGLDDFNSQRGVVVKSHKLVDNTAGVLTDIVEIIPETNTPFPKKVVLDITCDSRGSGDGQWLISGHGGSRQRFAKTGVKLTVVGGQSDITPGASGSVTFAAVTHKPKAGDVIMGLHSDARLEVTEDTPAGSNVVTVKNTGSTTVGATDNLTQAPDPGFSAEFIAGYGKMFIDPDTGVHTSLPEEWQPPKPGFYNDTTP